MHLHRFLYHTTGSGRLGGMTADMQFSFMATAEAELDYEQLISLDEELLRDRNKADSDQIDALPVEMAKEADKEIRCCICMCDVEVGDELRVLPCGHKYHKSCIDQWLTYNGCCPVDKKRIAKKRRRCLRTRAMREDL